MAAEKIAFPLLADGHHSALVDGLTYPLSFSFSDGSHAPLFTSGVVPAEELEQVARLTAERIAARYGGQRLLVIQILEGARTFAGMVRPYLEDPHGLRFELATVQVRSYGQGSQAAAHRIVQPLRDQWDQELTECGAFDGVVVLDDLIDGGQTVAWLVRDYLPRFAVRGLGVCTMLEKDRQRSRAVDEVLSGCLLSAGRRVPDEWLVGYGLDMALPGGGDIPDLHLFRQALPGGIYAFNSAIEERLLAAYQTNPTDVRRQLKIYLSPA